MNLINLTPHTVTIIGDKDTIQIEPSGTLARCQTDRKITGAVSIAGISIPTTKTEFGAVTGLPDQQHDTAYIVSSIVAQACPSRKDLCIVDDSVRDNEGRIIGCKALSFPNKHNELALIYTSERGKDCAFYSGKFSDGTECSISDVADGASIYVEIRYPNGATFAADYGTNIHSSEKYSEFSYLDAPYLALIQEQFGYEVPSMEDIENERDSQER